MWGIGERLGNLVQGRGFRTNLEYAGGQLEEEKKRREAQAVSPPTIQQPARATVPLTPDRQSDTSFKIPVLQVANQKPVVDIPKEEEPGFWQGLGAGLQQAGGRVGDTFLQAGGLVNYGVTGLASIGKSQEERDRMFDEAAEMNENARTKLINDQRDISGNMIVGNRDIDEAATRVAQGTASPDDFRQVAGRSADVALTVSSVLPIGAGATAARTVAQPGARAAFQAAKPLLTETAALGTAGIGADLLNDRGVTPESLALNYGLPLAAGGIGFAGQRAISSMRAGSRVADEQARQALQVAAKPEAELGAMGDGTISPNKARSVKDYAQNLASSLTNVKTRIEERIDNYLQMPENNMRNAGWTDEQIADAMRSRGEPASLGTNSNVLPAQQPVAPQQVLPQPERLVPFDETPIQLAPTPFDEPVAPRPLEETQVALTEQQLAPAPEVPVARPVEPATVLESPTATQSRTVAENTVPVNTVITDMPATGNAADVINPYVDTRLSDLEARARSQVADANNILASEGKTFSDVTAKLYDAHINKKVAELTTAEKQVYNSIKPTLDEALGTATERGLMDVDSGRVRDYAPTGKMSEITVPKTIDDIANQDFSYAKTREGGLTTKEVKEGADEAYVDYIVRGIGSKYLDEKQLVGARSNVETVNKIDELYNPDNMSKLPEKARFTPSEKSSDDIQAASRERVEADIDAQKLRQQSQGDKISDEQYRSGLENSEKKQLGALKKELDAVQSDVNAKVAEIKSDGSLTSGEKRGMIMDLQDYMDNVRKNNYYQQLYVQTNVLMQVAGRTADQAAKGLQTTLDAVTGLLSNRVAGGTFAKGAGRALRGDMATVKAVSDIVNPRVKGGRLLSQRRLDRANSAADTGLKGLYNRIGSRVTSWGSREAKPLKETISYFTAKAQADSITDVNKIADYVASNIGKKEWTRIHDTYDDFYNKFSGVSGYRGKSRYSFVNKAADLATQGANLVARAIPGIEKAPKVRANIAKALEMALVGFPRVVGNIGVKGADMATLGLNNLRKAASIKVVDDATAFQKAMYMKEFVDAAAQGGTVGLGLGYLAGANGLTTGAYPEDAAERKRWQDEGIAPYSLKIGDMYVEPSRFMGPLAIPFTVMAAVGSGEGDPAQVLESVIGGVAQNFGIDAVADGVSLLTDAAQGKISFGQTGANLISMFAPLSAQINQIGNATDNYERDAKGSSEWETFSNNLQRKVPELRKGLPEKTDQFGNKIQSNPLSSVIPLSGKGSQSEGQDSPVMGEIARLRDAGVEAYPKGVSGTSSDFKLKNSDGETISLDSKQQKSLNNAVKSEKERYAKLIMDSSEYRSASDEAKGKMLQDVYSIGSSSVAGKWAADNNIEGAKQSTAISEGIPEASQRALVVKETMDSDTHKKWLDDTTNARDYNLAAYENAVSNNTLTAEDDSLQTKSGLHYKAIASQVNLAAGADAKLLTSYKDITKKEFAAMSDDNPLKAKLWKLDQARAASGVSDNGSDTSLSKYGDDSSGSGSGGKAKSTISTPSVISGSGSGSGSSQKYIGINRSSGTAVPQVAKATPKGRRRISVTRGVKL